MQEPPRKPKTYKWVVFREKLNVWDALFVVENQVPPRTLLRFN